MPVIRNLAALYRGTKWKCGDDSEYDPLSSRPSAYRASATLDTKLPKKKKPSNAFFLYRSYVLANNLLPAGVKHQNDASRIAAQMWKTAPLAIRMHFFVMAEERKKEQAGEAEEVITSSPPVSSASSHPPTNSTCASPPTPDSPCPQAPSAPYVRPRKLPEPWTISSSPSWKLEQVPEPNYDEPLLFALSDEWSSPDPTSSLSLMRDADDADACSNDNALGLYFWPTSSPTAFTLPPTPSDAHWQSL